MLASIMQLMPMDTYTYVLQAWCSYVTGSDVTKNNYIEK